MNKSSFLNGLLNEKQKNAADYLATWDNLNVFWKSLGKAWDFVAGFWSNEKELEQADKDSYIEKVDSYIRNHKKPEFKLHASLYKRLTELFDIECNKISSQKELDEYFLKLENEAILFQRKFSFKEEKMKPFYGHNFYELRIYFLDVMVEQFKGLENEKQEKILKDMVDKLHTLSAEELENFKEKIKEKLSLIKKGNLKPEFPIPENEEELRSFVGINKITVDEQRKTRQRLRIIAKKDSAVYGMI